MVREGAVWGGGEEGGRGTDKRTNRATHYWSGGAGVEGGCDCSEGLERGLGGKEEEDGCCGVCVGRGERRGGRERRFGEVVREGESGEGGRGRVRGEPTNPQTERPIT